MPSPRNTRTTGSHGTNFGTEFDDKTIIRDINTAVIRRIVVTSDTNLRSITVHYTDVVGVTHGAAVGTCSEVTLQPGELITKVEGNASLSVIAKIEFMTSNGRKSGPFGKAPLTTTCVWDGFGPGMGLLYLSGKFDNYVRMLKATFGMYPVHPDPAELPAFLKYEKHVTAEAASQTSTPRFKFTTVLISPTVTLVIGTDKTILNVSQHILCRLPFFRAALQGNFLKTSKQTVNMPEDEPQYVTALLEFLYTGHYSYPYYTEIESGSDRPAPNPAEGLHHVGVYAIAHKYGCLELVAVALDLFMYVLRRLAGIDVVRLWKGANAMNLLLKEVEDNDKLGEFKRGLVGLFKELYVEHRAEMETTVAEYPLLWSDLFSLVVFL